MNAMINISQAKIGNDNVNTVDARKLHEFLQISTKFKDWIARRIAEYDFEEGKDFCSILSESNGGRPSKEYFLNLDMAKEISMVERSANGKAARKYFIECEKRLKAAPAVNLKLDDPAQLRGILLGYTEKVIELEAKLDTAEPKARAYDQFVNARGLYGLQNAARLFGARPNKFITWLRVKYLFDQGGCAVPYLQYTRRGYFTVKTNIIDGKTRPQTFITPKGIDFLRDLVPVEIMIMRPKNPRKGAA